MQSGQDNQALPQDLVQPIVSSPVPNPLDPVLPVQAREILKGLKDADTPLDFIRANIKAPENNIDPAAMAREVEAARGTPPATPTPPSEPTTPQAPPTSIYDLNPPKVETLSTEKKVEEPLVPEQPLKEEAVAEPAVEEPVVEEPLSDKEENFKNLRRKLSETAKALEEHETKERELESRVQKYETGEELPEIIKQKDERIAELEKYERLHALKLSPAYKEAFIKPAEEIKLKLGSIAQDYELPGDILEQALNITNKRDLNAFLSEHFDDVGALEVRSLIVQAQEIAAKASEAEMQPAQALSTLEESFRKEQEIALAHSRNSIIEASKSGWIDSLLSIREEGRVQELIHRENDVEYNKSVVEPILTAAASEYGKLVKMLAENGLETLPKDVAYALARMVHMAHASAISIESRDRAAQEAEELKRNTERTTKYLRPAVGSVSFGGGSASQGGPAPQSPKEAADILLNKVMGKS